MPVNKFKNEINILIRADGSSKIGLGHIIRTMALANELTGRGCHVYYLTKSDEKVVDILADNAFEVISIEQDLDIKGEIDIVNKNIKEKGINIFVGDSFCIDRYYLSNLDRNKVLVVLLDNLRDMSLDADLIINGGIYAPDFQKKAEKYNTKALLGLSYTLLREQFMNLKTRIINKDVKNILITMGGADVLNMTYDLMEYIIELDGKLHLNVIVGNAFTKRDEIKSLAQNNPNISLYSNVNNMAELMEKNDIAISAGGTTLYELAATGTPTITIVQADNQFLQATKFDKKKMVINAGDGHEISKQKFLKILEDLIINYERRKEMSKLGQSSIDGKGANRCSSIILEEYNNLVFDNKNNYSIDEN
ncbi:MAG: UDP-2,4-diacetamido-2,4,6-trideoxy-beta-L-altropyranose hydrolase [Tissierella sp.]|uniref:UDP-2,4-diacetamido-2,4, 6-trideoxy-beta-L-altropyranose hydrolase n=1 Tax=Tissierella sp. TaxID=41274 RepID=UPI003F94F2AF